MLRYEIRSNAASSDQGLHRFPVLDDFVQTLAAQGVEARVVQQTHREEGEVNLASGRHARGVVVRGTAVRTHTPETHVKGCLSWMRAVVAHPERGLHVEIARLRATNGAALLFGQVLARKQRVFVSGPDADAWRRLTAQVDPAFQAIPKEIAASEALCKEYLGRATRPTGFVAALNRLSTLGLLPEATQAQAKVILTSRDASQLRNLSEAQIVNVGLLDELVERYDRLVEQFCTLLGGEGTLGDLPALFELLVQGADFNALRERFAEFALPEKSEAIVDKRTLVNELRIGLARAQGVEQETLKRRLLCHVVRLRAVRDPRLYTHVHLLDPVDGERLEALAPARALFVAWVRNGGPPSAAEEEADLPVERKQSLFELAVNLVYQARLTQRFREGSEPPPVLVARELLASFALSHLDLRRLSNLHAGLPARGVARDLAEKVQVSGREFKRVQLALWAALFPRVRLAAQVARELAVLHRDEARERGTRAREVFLLGAHRLLGAMNYVLGNAGGQPVLRQAALAAGRALGLNMLASRDQIRSRHADPALPALDDEERAEGYQLLLVRDDARWFPMRAGPAQLAGAYLHLYRERVATSVRRLVNKKLKYLYDRHGTALFAVIHEHLTWSVGLTLSPEQLAALLIRTRVFDAPRLREFGYVEGEPAAAEGANPWLQAAVDGAGAAQLAPFLGSRAEAECLAATNGLAAVVEGYGTPPRPMPERPALAQALAALAADGHYDLHAPASRQALAATAEADTLSEALAEVLQGLLAVHAKALAALEAGDALEIGLPGRLGLLALLRERHEVALGERKVQVRLLAAPAHADVSGAAGEVLRVLAGQVQDGAKGPLPDALACLTRHDEAWRRLTHVAALPLLDQVLQGTVLSVVEPAPPLAQDLRALPEEQVLCLGASSHDQARFSRIVAHPERRDVYATLSELASWQSRFGRLREEQAYYRELIDDVREIIAGLNLSAFDAPYVTRYAQALTALDEALAVRPEEFTGVDLADVERLARDIGALVRSYYDQERSVPMRARWMSRIAMRLRAMHPDMRLTFVDALHEQPRPAAQAPADAQGDESGTPGSGRRDDYQTFSERVRNVVQLRERLASKRAFVVSPNNTQRQLALAVIDQLYRLKGVHTAIFVDISGCEALVEHLRTRIPPHRLFDLNAL